MKQSCKWNEFDPQKSLLKLPIFWLALVMVVALAAGVAGYIFSTDKLSYQPGYEGVNQLLNIFKVPIGILALIIPIWALLASNHRSVQTKEQIALIQEQNLFANYYKHLEEFKKYCEAHDSLLEYQENEFLYFKVKSYAKLHAYFFLNSYKGDYSIDPKKLIILSEDLMALKTKRTEILEIRYIFSPLELDPNNKNYCKIFNALEICIETLVEFDRNATFLYPKQVQQVQQKRQKDTQMAEELDPRVKG